jgi:CRISPR-associated endonuclease/helicase Cas3
MNDMLLFWAKLGDETWPEKYHPVLCHLIDVGQVARRLWNDVCRQRVKDWVRHRLGLPDENTTGAWLAFWAAAHDIGKICPGFQVLGDDRTAKLRESLPPPEWDYPPGKTPHGIISTAITAEALKDGTGWPAVHDNIARLVAVAIGGHHGIFPTNWDESPSHLGNTRWRKAQQEIFQELARLFGVAGLTAPKMPDSEDQSVWMYLAGLTSVADWIGSNVEFFPPAGNPSSADGSFNVDGYFAEAGKKASDALEKLGWLGRAETTTPIDFRQLFPFIDNPRPLQTTVAELVEAMTRPGLLIVEGPMGEGKTEAGWFAAASWDRRGGQGSYVALPTMATSNQMFGRVETFLSADGEGKKNLMLQHGKAAVNKMFDGLKYRARLYDEEKQPSAVVAEEWFAANKKHGLLAPYGVGTIDQILLAVLQTKHVFVRLFGLAGKCVILDEVHAYDTYMTTLMERLLRWLAALGCPVVLLSATLPKEKRLALLRAYVGADVPEPDHVPYPRVISVMIGAPPKATQVQADPNRAKTVQLGWIAEDNLVEQLRATLANGGCAAVIRNTVGLAQETFVRLREGLKDAGITVGLFHARFPFGRRSQIENDVLNRYGKKGGPAERNKHVLVATQVIEQSLDLDFDVMISDVAPADLVLQRAGRLQRHARGIDRPAGLSQAKLWLIEPVMEGGVPDFGLSGFVYSEYILFRSLLALRSDDGHLREKIDLPAEIDALVEFVYSDDREFENLTPPEQRFWKESKACHEKKQAKEQAEAEVRQIKKPQFRGALARVIGEPREEDSPDLHPAHQALTRLTRPTAQLICLMLDSFGSRSMIHDGTLITSLSIRKMSGGGAQDIRRLILAELTTAHPGVVRELWDNPLKPKEWTQVGMLQNHHLITFTDGCAQVGNYEMILDNELGLTVVRGDRKEEDE